MGLKISDATKEELIQYFFTEDTFGGGHIKKITKHAVYIDAGRNKSI